MSCYLQEMEIELAMASWKGSKSRKSHSVGKHASKGRDLILSDFEPIEKYWTTFPLEGSKSTPPHQSVYFKWKDYCPMVFSGLDVENHNIVNDMIMTQEVTYHLQGIAEGVHRDANMVVVLTVGFVKDTRAHIDVQGFNVYHKNRLIKSFWRVWNAVRSAGRGVIEVNFVEPAHHKQGFERTTVLARLDTKLVNVQKTFWSTNCHKIVYAPRHNKTSLESTGREMIVLAMKWRFRTKVVHSNPEAAVGGLASMILVHILVVVLSVLSAGGTCY